MQEGAHKKSTTNGEAPVPREAYLPLRYSVLLIILSLLVPLLLAMSLTNYFAAKKDLLHNQELMQRQSEAGIATAMRKIEGGYRLLQKAMETDLGPAFAAFAHIHDAAHGRLERMDLQPLKSRFGEHFDFYVIDAGTGVVEFSTLPQDLGLDLSVYTDFWKHLQSRLAPGTVVTGPIDVETRTGVLRQYSYLLLPNRKHILEIGVLAKGFSELVQELNYNDVTEEVQRLNPAIERVRIFESQGYLDKDPQRTKAKGEVLEHVLHVVAGKRDREVHYPEQGRLVRYHLVDLSGPDGWPAYKVAELTYSTTLLRERLHERAWTQAGISLGFVALAIVLSLLVARRISAPINRIVSDVNRIAEGDLDHPIQVKSRTELRILERSIAAMVQRIVRNMQQLERAEAEISSRNLELERGNLELTREIRDRERMEQNLRQSELILRAFLDAIPESAVLLDPDGFIVEVNQEASKRLERPREELVGSIVHAYVSWEVFERRHEKGYDAICGRRVVDFEDENSGRIFHNIFAPVYNTRGDVEYLAAYMTDITERRLTEREILLQKIYFQQLFENAPLGIALCDGESRVRKVNRAFERLFRYSEEELSGSSLDALIVPHSQSSEAPEVHGELESGKALQLETVRKRKDGRLVHVAVLAFPVIIEGRPDGAYIVYQDITERKRAEEQLVFQSFHDTLTGFPNRALLLDRLQRTIQRLRQRRFPLFALLYLDLDRFKVVNDSLGHQVGDQLIHAVSRKLGELVSSTDTVSRIGGDEFAVLLDEVDSPRQALNLARTLQETLSRPMVIDSHEIFSSASIGIVVGAEEHDRPEMILRDAEIAMYRAKTAGRNRIKLFQSGMREQAADILRLENDLRRAVENREFVVHYQPIISLERGAIIGFEALLRWRHPSRGLVFPDEFIPVAEESGLIIPIGLLVLESACRQVRQWQRQYPACRNLEISVNLSARQFLQSDLIEQINGTAHDAGLDMQHLKLEITESVVMENAQSARVMLQRLKDLNVKLSIDDFGTGYSSLAYLHQFPIDTLKVDRSFVARMEGGDEDTEIVRAIVVLAHNLGMEVVAEGVETQMQAEQLRSMNCDYFQGYLASRPLESEAAEALLMALPHWWIQGTTG
jgi:diguanylate cyclase (GGDEF)-like protein/PAS domain S-box-containing protein